MSAGIGRIAALAFSLVRRARAVAVVAGALALPELAEACAVCTSGRDDESNAAFLISTIFLSLLPLAALGTLVFVLWRRIQKLETETTASDAGLMSAASAAPSAARSAAASTAAPPPVSVLS